ncbi:hypothetical protein PR202_gb13751 [Eleusine coracana subsp. coracana]|uniref:GH18 domain-containing protein n=1 Tax=Eleusine coracana subsp. coracana TaxID=191504 RepID=A0AAV5ET81_ELECO|nr:hypothetical protein PR202_gb13751 [Eleusine coracana subsp. coracana]
MLLVLMLVGMVAGPAAAGKTGQLTVFWGRNKDEGSLREACDTGVYTTVIISFFSVFGHGKYLTDLSGHPLNGVGADIKHCQSKNILVLLSIGGDGNGYSLPTAKSARDVADQLWNAYLGGNQQNGVSRPFGDAVLDGVDFFIDHGGSANYDELARRLAAYNNKNNNKNSKKKAVLDDTNSDTALSTGLIGRIHVRFYNNTMCSFNDDSDLGTDNRRPFYGAWLGWAERYPNAKLFVGLPAAKDAVADGWIEPVNELPNRALPLVQDTPGYAGVMLWNRYFDRRDNYGLRIKNMV